MAKKSENRNIEPERNTGNNPVKRQPIPTGIPGLDHVLSGGLPPERLYLIQGDPGVGKTTLGLQYLREGAQRKERSLYITLSETEEELRTAAASHNWDLTGINIHQVTVRHDKNSDPYTLFHPSEVELTETTDEICAVIDRLKPQRLVFDSLSELRLLARDPLRYRRQILGFKQFFSGRHCTVLILDDRTSENHELQLQTIAHGVIVLEQLAPEFGGERRRMRVVKMREMKFRGGYHDFAIEENGIIVFPRLVAAEYGPGKVESAVGSGIAEIDALLGGGLNRGSSTLLMGSAGTGKSSVAMQFVIAAAKRGERSALYIFDEAKHTLLMRCDSMGINLRPHFESGMVTIQQIDPAELSPGEFVHRVRQMTISEGARMIVIDSLNGYLNAMPEEKFLTIQMHELLSFLGQHGVVTLLVVSQNGFVGNTVESPVFVSYLADTVILLRYYEQSGEVKKALSVVKKRTGAHERSIRELIISDRGLQVGPPLKDFNGILSGMPIFGERKVVNGSAESTAI